MTLNIKFANISGSNVERDKFNPRLEALRGLAALMVLLGHCISNFTQMRLDLPIYQQVDLWGYSTRFLAGIFHAQGAVLLFFVLSGYVLALSLSKSNSNGLKDYAAYLIRRISRLYPVHMAVLIAWLPVIYVMRVLAPTPALQGPGLSQAYVNTYSIFLGGENWPTMGGFLENASLVSWDINPVSWSLSVEMFANLFLPAMAIFAASPSIFQRLLMLVGLLWLMATQMYSNYLLAYLAAFYGGTLVLQFGSQTVDFVDKIFGLNVTLIVIAIAYFAPMMMTENRPFIVLLSETISSCMLVAIVAYRPTSPSLSFLDFTNIKFVGRISYPLYLIHFLVLICLLRATHWMFDGQPERLQQGLLLAPFAVICLAISAVFAWYLHRWIEKPASEWGRAVSRIVSRR